MKHDKEIEHQPVTASDVKELSDADLYDLSYKYGATCGLCMSNITKEINKRNDKVE